MSVIQVSSASLISSRELLVMSGRFVIRRASSLLKATQSVLLKVRVEGEDTNKCDVKMSRMIGMWSLDIRSPSE